jgi:hypothetical protein
MTDDHALEAKERRRRIRSGAAVHQDHEPTPLVVLDPCTPIGAVLEIRAEVMRLQRTGAGSYLFIDPAMHVFVVSELRSVAAVWVKQHFGWLVAFYAPRTKSGEKRINGVPFMAATVDGITEDVEQHLLDLRRNAPCDR